METTEKIVEAYVRYINGWFTIPNIKCSGQFEIDLLAFDPNSKKKVNRYHIESGVSISSGFSKLNNKPYSKADLKIRVKTAKQRRTLGYFVERKFGDENIIKKLAEFGFYPGNYQKVIVTWDWEDDVPAAARNHNIELWSFMNILKNIAESTKSGKTYFMDDTMRTLQLMAKATKYH